MYHRLDTLQKTVGFQWDTGNLEKNWRRHRVTQAECEQVFANHPVVSVDEGHSGDELRHYALGQTGPGRHLTITFTVRNSLVRVISARPMSRREGRVHAEGQA